MPSALRISLLYEVFHTAASAITVPAQEFGFQRSLAFVARAGIGRFLGTVLTIALGNASAVAQGVQQPVSGGSMGAVARPSLKAAIRYYEREGVVPQPARAGSGRYRQYSDADVERLAFLHRARELGFSLAEVRALLTFSDGDPGRSCGEVDALARAHLTQVNAKLAQLTALCDALAGVIDQCRGRLAVADCRILGALGGFAAAEVNDGDTGTA